jgi:hypothetical protein
MTPIDQLTQDLATAQAEIARLREALNTLTQMKSTSPEIRQWQILAIQALQALSQSSLALQEYRDMKQIAHLIGSIFFAGNFIAETANERELEALLIKNGFRYKSWDEITEMEGKSC